MVPESLIRTSIRVFESFLERRLHERFDDQDSFLFELPGKVDLFGCILGSAGIETGLHLVEGPEARDALAAVQSGVDPRLWEWDAQFSSVTLSRADELSRELRAFVARGGAFGDRVPCFFVQPADELPRLPQQVELERMVRILAALTRADTRGLLSAKGEAVSGLVPRIRVSGPLSKPKVHVELVAMAESERETPEVLPVPSDLATLPRIAGSWTVGIPGVPGRIVSEPRQMRALLLYDDANDQIRAMDLVLGRDFELAAEKLFQALRGENEVSESRPGLPSELRFLSPGLHARLGAGFEELGVRCVSGAVGGAVFALLDHFAQDVLRQGSRDPSILPASGDYDGWARAYDRAYTHLVETECGSGTEFDLRRQDYLGDTFDELPEPVQVMLMAPMLEWWSLRYREEEGSASAVERVLSGDLPPVDREVLRALQESRVSAYRYEDRAAGEAVLVTDLLTGESLQVREPGLTRDWHEGETCLLRVFRLGDLHFATCGSPMVPANASWWLLHWLDSLELLVEGEGIPVEMEGALGGVWMEYVAEVASGEEGAIDRSELVVGWQIEDANALRGFLQEQCEAVQSAEDVELWTWAREGSGVPGDVRLLVHGDRVTMMGQVVDGAGELREILSLLPGLELKIEELRERPSLRELRMQWEGAAHDLPGSESATEAAPVDAAFYLSQLDTVLPILADRTPREAASDPEAHAQLRRWVRWYPERPSVPRVRVPRDEMLQELGIE